MNTQAERGPVFLLGPPRSGTALLGWSLDQHPALAHVLDAPWIARLGMAVDGAFGEEAERSTPVQLAAAGISEERFARAFGEAIDALLRGRGTRWVDSTPASAFAVAGLARMFVGARFIHVIRDAGSAVRSMVDLQAPDRSYFTPESACETWYRTVEAGVLAERALGSALVHRVFFHDLVRDPEMVLRAVLDFLDEPFDAACLRLLHGADPERAGMTAHFEAPTSGVWQQAAELSRALHEHGAQHVEASPAAMQNLNAAFRLRSLAAANSGDGSRLDRIRTIVAATVPAGAVALVVSRGDEELVRLRGPRGWHFPRTEDGQYAGYHPPDSRSAIEHLETLRAHGADFLVFPCTAYWWLEHYTEFRQHLEARHRLVSFHEDACRIYALRSADVRTAAGVRVGAGSSEGGHNGG